MKTVNSTTRFFLFLLCLLLAIGCSEKLDEIASGTTDNLTWTLSSDGTLTIGGTGEIPNQVSFPSWGETTFLWSKYRYEINRVIIGKNISGIGNRALSGHFNLTSIDVDSNNPLFSSEDGVLFNKSKTILIIYPVGKTGAYTIPNSVTHIGEGVFEACSSLTSITIPNSVTHIGERVFLNCRDLTSVTIGNSVTLIGNSAFYNCNGLTSITIPNSVTSIENNAFLGCSSLISVTLGSSVTSISDWAFLYSNNLTSIDVDNNNPVLSSEGGVLFNKTKTTLIRYPEGKTGAYTIPNSVTSIENNAFAGCNSLTSVTIGNSVSFIGNFAFYMCRNLTSVNIPSSVTYIEDGAFSLCISLAEIINESVTPQMIQLYLPNSVANVFHSVNKPAATLRVSSEAIEAYRAAIVWQDFGNIVAIE